MKNAEKKISKRKIEKSENDLDKNNIKKALCKKALGFSIDEITEEYGREEGDKLKLLKRKVVSKQIPPDITALKILFEYEGKESDFTNLTDEELLREKERLLKILKDEVKNDDSRED